MQTIGVGYIRVSTADQRDNGVSLEMQTSKIVQYCALHDITLVGIYGDPGISAKNVSHRPGALAILELAKKKRINAVVTYKLDRLARNTIECLEISQLLDKAGVGLHSICEKLDTKSAMGRFFFTLISAIAEMERGIISERTAAALGQKKANNDRVSRYAPVGYTFDMSRVVPRKSEQTAQCIARAAHRDGASLRQTARLLKAQGFVNREGKLFHPSTINKMIRGGE